MNTIESMKEGFDQVKVRHYNGEGTYRATHVALVKGLDVFIGIAKLHPRDQFNKKLGLQIALGRALFAWKTQEGLEKPRDVSHWSYRVSAGAKEDIYDILSENVFSASMPVEGVVVDSGECDACIGCDCPEPVTAELVEAK